MSNVWTSPLGRTVFERTYSRRKPDGSQEEWHDTVDRVVHGNCNLVPEEFIESGERERLTELIGSFALLPAGRHLFVTGTDSPYTFNCHVAGWGPRLRDHVGFLMSVLMTGGGSGSDYQNSAISVLQSPTGAVEPRFLAPIHEDQAEFSHRLGPPSPAGAVYRVPDSREGWCEALCKLTDLAETGGGEITFDVTDVRPRGSIIKRFGGTASGPGPLIEMLANVADILNGCVGRPYTSLDLMEVDQEIGACVIAGNVRRSARMSVKHWADDDIFDFISCKADPAAHWSTNVSVGVDGDFFTALDDGETHARAVMEEITTGMVINGEPGVVNMALAQVGEATTDLTPNPCAEIFLEPFEPCCLGHVNLAHYGNDLRGTAEAVRLMARFLVRATFAAIDDPRQREVVDRNRRIGVGLMGFTEWGAAHGYRYSQIARSEIMGAKLGVLRNEAVLAADQYAAALAIPKPIKHTCVAPTGSVSTLPGVTSGIQSPFARYFIRRIRFAADDPQLEEHVAAGHHIEDDVYAANTKVVAIPCRDSILDRFDEHLIEQADELSPADLIRTQAFVQKWWADNAISFTVNVGEDVTASHLAEVLEHFLPELKGVTVFPEMSRPQSPYERITKTAYQMATGAETTQAMDECVTGCPVR